MALSGLIQWEIRPANGGANNGGGFKTGAGGTDRSQQNAAHVVIDGATISATVHTSTNEMTLVGYTVVAADLGNVVCVSGGTATAGLYEITAVDTGNNRWTVDRSLGSSTQTIIGAMGGARTGIANGATALATAWADGNIAWIKNEAGWNESASFGWPSWVNTSPTNPVIIEGYNTTRGDAPTGNDRPVNARGAAAGDVFNVNYGAYIFKHIRVTGTAQGRNFHSQSARVVCINCKTTGGAYGYSSSGQLFLYDCEASGCSTVGVDAFGDGAAVVGCYIHDGTGSAVGVRVNNDFAAVVNTIAEANPGSNFQYNGGTVLVLNCTGDGATGASADGFETVAGTIPIVGSALINCIFSHNGRYGASMGTPTQANPLWTRANNYYGNTTAARDDVPAGPGDLAVDPSYVDRAGGNFAIQAASLRGAGSPGAFPGGLTTGYIDIGAAQSSSGVSAGGGGLKLAGRGGLAG